MTDDGPAVGWVGEGLPIPLARSTYQTFRTSPTKIAVLVAFQKEALRYGDPRSQRRVLSESANNVTSAINGALLSDNAATSDQPAGIGNGALGFVGGRQAA